MTLTKGMEFTIISINENNNTLEIGIKHKEVNFIEDDWNLKHTRTAFRRGDYNMITLK